MSSVRLKRSTNGRSTGMTKALLDEISTANDVAQTLRTALKADLKKEGSTMFETETP